MLLFASPTQEQQVRGASDLAIDVLFPAFRHSESEVSASLSHFQHNNCMARSGDISYPPAASSESETEQFRQGDPDATARPQNPLDPLRKGNVVMELAGAGILCLGCESCRARIEGAALTRFSSPADLLVCLYVTGPPRLSDYASASTGVLLLNLILGGVAAMPSW